MMLIDFEAVEPSGKIAMRVLLNRAQLFVSSYIPGLLELIRLARIIRQHVDQSPFWERHIVQVRRVFDTEYHAFALAGKTLLRPD